MKVKSMCCIVRSVETRRDYTNISDRVTGETVRRKFDKREKTEASLCTLDGGSFYLPVFAGCKPGDTVIVTITEGMK